MIPDQTLPEARILIVDDQEANVAVLEALLESEGYLHFKSTTDSRRTLDLYTEFQPDLILLDLRMPHLDGFAVMEQLRAVIPAGTYLPILVLTADITPEAKQRALSSGATDFLTKPFDAVEVTLRVKNLLQTRFLHRQLRDQNQVLEARVHERTAQLERETTRIEAVLRMANRLNAELDLQAALKMVCEETSLALNASATTVTLYDAKREMFYVAADFGLPPEYRQQASPTPREVYELHARLMGPIIAIPDVQAQPGLPDPDLYARLNMRTVVSAMMRREGQLVGSLSVITLDTVRHLTEDELALLQGLADQAVQAITNARLFAQTERRLQRLIALRTVDSSITASLDLHVPLDVVLEQVLAQLGVDAADVLLLNPYTLSLAHVAGRGFRSRAIEHTHQRLGEGNAGRAALERRVLSVPNLPTGNDLLRGALLAGEDFVAYYAAPLIAKGQVEGVLEIFHRAPLDPEPEWLDFLEALAGQAAIAVDNARLFDDLQRKNVELMLAYDATIEGWSRALDLRDKETEGHTLRVTEMTLRLARAMGLNDEELVHIRRGALLHDIGKMGVPDAILLKPGSLTEAEWAIMRQHPTHAYEMLAPVTFLQKALDIPYAHHEKWDGTGYPRGLRGEQIPLAARVFAVIDVWDALRSDRPYRAGWPEEKVLTHLRALAGAHFDARVIEVFLKMHAELAR